MSIKHIAQPYIVYTSWNESNDYEMKLWLRENILSYYLVLYVSNGAFMAPSEDAPGKDVESLSKMLQFQFECPRDALLFKLTWGEK